jgi:mannose-1-phosphate guanylyltransferase
MCGGSGPRLWPLSRATLPKQFLQLFSDNSLIKETYNRFKRFVPIENIFFISHQKYLEELRAEFGKSIPSQNYITEPDKKNTAMAILHGALVIKKHNPNAIISAVPADHFIDKLPKFKRDLQLAYRLAQTGDNIVAIGIKPTYANPGFGYILTSKVNHEYSQVSHFVEKPSVTDAQILIKKDALWNSGMYTFSPDNIIKELSIHAPSYRPIIDQLSTSTSKATIKSAYALSPTLPIDKAVSEKTKKLIIFPATFSWSDVGEWHAIWQHLQPTKDGLVVLRQKGQYVAVNSKNCLISGSNKKLIGLVGLNNLAIIDTPDSLLVCSLHDSFSVRELVKKIVSDPLLKKYFLNKHERQPSR